MSMDNAVKFYEKVKADQSLQQKIGELAKENPKEIEAVIIKTAKESGLEFSEEEMKEFLAEEAKKIEAAGELGDSELEAVAGGGKGSWIAASILGMGVYCASSALGREMGGCSLDD